MKLRLVLAFLLTTASIAYAQNKSAQPGEDVNDAIGRRSTFGMNGDPQKGVGHQGGDTSRNYQTWMKKEGLKEDPVKKDDSTR